MNPHPLILKWLLYGGAVYFFLVAVSHMFAIKIPMLFVYFNVPSYAYQDKIISFLSFGWSLAFLLCARNKIPPFAILAIGLIGIIGLSIVNFSTDFKAIDPQIHPAVFWWETAALFVYWLAVLSAYKQIKK